jgi:hypothetical protein
MFGILAMRGVGALLLLAAALKMYGLAVEPVGRAAFFRSRWMQTLIGLGCPVLTGLYCSITTRSELP